MLPYRLVESLPTPVTMVAKVVPMMVAKEEEAMMAMMTPPHLFDRVEALSEAFGPAQPINRRGSLCRDSHEPKCQGSTYA